MKVSEKAVIAAQTSRIARAGKRHIASPEAAR
jgi:hypothetical protein